MALGPFFAPPAAAQVVSKPAPAQSVSAPANTSIVPAPGLPVPGGDVQAALAVYEQNIFWGKDPFYALSLLTLDRGQEVQVHLLKTDPDRLAKLFRTAAELKDLYGLLKAHGEPGLMREALIVRADSELASRPAKLYPWARRWAPEVDAKLLLETLCDWSALQPAQIAWLKEHRNDEASWKELSLAERGERMEAWGATIAAQVMATVPKSSSEYDKLRALAMTAWNSISKRERVILSERLMQAKAAADSFTEAEKKLQTLNDPKLKALLDSAKGSGTLENALSSLDLLFDNMGERRQDLQWAAPAKPEGKLDPKDREILSTMLRQGLLDYIKGTTAGDRLNEFYKTVPLKLVVQELDINFLAAFNPGDQTILLNERSINELARLDGRSAKDLLCDSRVFEAALKLLSPWLVHEGIHHLQYDWSRKKGLPSFNEQDHEIEAMSMDALFTLQKAASDPSFRKLHAEKQKFSSLARNSILKAETLRRDPARYRDMVRSSYYPHLYSIEGQCVAIMDGSVAPRELFQTELKRREALPKAEREALASSGAVWPSGQLTLEQFKAELRKVKTSLVQSQLALLASRDRAMPYIYAMWRERYEGVNSEVESELQRLPKPGAPPPPAKKREPPPPMPVAGKTPPKGT
jgi:hypothetical protein